MCVRNMKLRQNHCGQHQNQHFRFVVQLCVVQTTTIFQEFSSTINLKRHSLLTQLFTPHPPTLNKEQLMFTGGDDVTVSTQRKALLHWAP